MPISGFKDGWNLVASDEQQQLPINIKNMEEGDSLQKGMQPQPLSLNLALRYMSDFCPTELFVVPHGPGSVVIFRVGRGSWGPSSLVGGGGSLVARPSGRWGPRNPVSAGSTWRGTECSLPWGSMRTGCFLSRDSVPGTGFWWLTYWGGLTAEYLWAALHQGQSPMDKVEHLPKGKAATRWRLKVQGLAQRVGRMKVSPWSLELNQEPVQTTQKDATR